MRTRFYAYLCDEGRCRSHPVSEAEDPIEAAIRFLECHGSDSGDDGLITLVIDDRELGQEHCFQVSLDGGKVAPC